MENNRSRKKDVVAFTVIYGGGYLTKTAIFVGFVVAGLMTPSFANAMKRAISHATSKQLDKAWEEYQETGNIIESIYNNFLADEYDNF